MNNSIDIEALLPKNCPNIAIIKGVIEGKIDGELFFNEEKNGFLLRTNSSFNFLGGRVSDNFFRKSLDRISKGHAPFLVHCNDPIFFVKKGLSVRGRSYFSCHANDIIEISDRIKKRIMSRYSLKEIDENLFEKCFWKSRIMEFYKTRESFMHHGYGGVVLNGLEIVAEVYGTIGGRFLELGAYVSPEYRGYALVPFIIGQLFKNYCLSKKLMIVASCETNNIASKKTIIKLGLREQCEYSVLDVQKCLEISNKI